MTTIHATAVALGEAGVLILGPSGAGKSRLAAALIERCGPDGVPAWLVGDDRIRLQASHGRLVARGHPILAGRLEIRGVGPCAVPAIAAAVVRIAVMLGDTHGERLPAADNRLEVEGIPLPLLRLSAQLGAGQQARVVRFRLSLSGKCMEDEVR